MTERLKTLRRIARLQEALAARAGVRLAAADRSCREIAAERQQLRDFVEENIGLTPKLSAAVFAAERRNAVRLGAAEVERARQKDECDRLKGHESIVGAMVEHEQMVARRHAEDRVLEETLEAWLSIGRASLP